MAAATSVTRALLEAHLVPAGGRGRLPPSGAEIALRVDHALMDAEAATLVFQGFEACGAAAAAVELALACAEGPIGSPSFEAGDELRYVQSAAQRYGVHCSRPGSGRGHHVYAARFAAPGRTVLTCATGGAAAGAMGSLALPVTELELAAALAGIPHAARVPELWAIRLAGSLPPGVGPHDLVMTLARRLPGTGGRPVALEYCGGGVAGLDQEARLTVARLGARFDLPPAVFPSDERTRDWLRAQGREPDWKPLAGEPEGEAVRTIEVALDTLEPQAARAAEGADPLAVLDVTGLPVRRVLVGADAGLADLLTLAESLAGRRVDAGVELVVVPGSRAIRATLGAVGALAALHEAGAVLLDAEARLAPGAGPGAVLLCGATPGAVGRARAAFHVGPAVAAASALAGRLADPRELPAPAATFPAPARVVPCEVAPVRPPAARAALEVVRGETIRPLPALAPMAGTLRGVVLQRFPDRVTTDRILPTGPTVWRHRGDVAALADHLYAGFDPTFAARARALGGGFVTAGADYGIGPHRPHAALALVALGVRAVIAPSFAPAHRAELIRHGVLPLRPGADLGPGELAVGDELEIPGMPDMLERSKPLVVRDLTRGTQLTLHHDLTAREIEQVGAGGLLGAAARTGATP